MEIKESYGVALDKGCVMDSSPEPEFVPPHASAGSASSRKRLSALMTVFLMIVQALCAGMGAIGVLLAQFSYDACSEPSHQCDFVLGNVASAGYFVVAGAVVVGSIVLLVIKRVEWHRMWGALLGGIVVISVVFGVTLVVVDVAAS
jgi:hypothetical protein